MSNFYDFTVQDIKGNDVSLATFKNTVIVVVNVASKCGFTPQYDGLQELYETYHKQGFTVLGFPCNQFANQEPGTNQEIQEFCRLNYGVTFPVMAKIDVNGEHEHPLYTFLKNENNEQDENSIKWNFTKFLIDRNGTVIKRFEPQVTPLQMAKDIETLL